MRKSQKFQKSKYFEFSMQDSFPESLEQLLVTFYVLNLNFFYSQVASYVLNNANTFFFFFSKTLIPFCSISSPFIFFFFRKILIFFSSLFSLFKFFLTRIFFPKILFARIFVIRIFLRLNFFQNFFIRVFFIIEKLFSI